MAWWPPNRGRPSRIPSACSTAAETPPGTRRAPGTVPKPYEEHMVLSMCCVKTVQKLVFDDPPEIGGPRLVFRVAPTWWPAGAQMVRDFRTGFARWRSRPASSTRIAGIPRVQGKPGTWVYRGLGYNWAAGMPASRVYPDPGTPWTRIITNHCASPKSSRQSRNSDQSKPRTHEKVFTTLSTTVLATLVRFRRVSITTGVRSLSGAPEAFRRTPMGVPGIHGRFLLAVGRQETSSKMPPISKH